MRAVVVVLSLLTLVAVADTLTLDNGKTLKGMLHQFKDQSFHFQEFTETKPTKVSANSVQRLRLSEPVACECVMSFDKKRQPATLHGFSKGQFSLTVKGKKQKVRAVQLAALEIPFNLQKFIAARDAQEAADGEGDEPKDVRAAALVEKGKATILHFDDGSAPSRRQGNLCERLASSSKGAVTYVRVSAKPGSAAVKRNRLKTTPQFWFFDRDGECQERLAERFAEEDIEKATERIRRTR
ncbi:MAG: hypothetical protein ACI4WT_10640 [Oligosphaeraceae bacterium]